MMWGREHLNTNNLFNRMRIECEHRYLADTPTLGAARGCRRCHGATALGAQARGPQPLTSVLGVVVKHRATHGPQTRRRAHLHVEEGHLCDGHVAASSEVRELRATLELSL